MKGPGSYLGSLADGDPLERERFARVWSKLTAFITDDANVANDEIGACCNVLLMLAVHVATQLGGDRDVFVKAAGSLWDAHQKTLATKKGDAS